MKNKPPKPSDNMPRRSPIFSLHFSHFTLPRIACLALLLAIFIIGTLRNPHFWLTADQRGDLDMRRRDYAAATKTYTDPARIATAQYRDGQFEAAAKTYARGPGPEGAYNQGNAHLMRGKYADAIASYDRALKLRPDWREATDNRALAFARKAAMDASSKDRADESADAYKPDEIAFDQKGDDKKTKPTTELTEENFTDDQLRALWLSRVQTTPADFLRAKFAYQAAKEGSHE